ncbi:E3 ubiquitin-protein ligase TRIM56 [Holothuria leucospilota]|uniref:E3 ubiquitin-protein ligase TRIM56 n=1 Tax=Holothuria leucospilota TaxID=206669 RepID=A0A9Q1BTA8_HOLLE|nr:E3 ubiquitin-protein ligase TRIM56 [Holothuria leucospilota]
MIQGTNDVIKCPVCRGEIQIPTNGVDGFKTDFYSKSLVEYVKIQQSLKSDEIRKCYGCSKHLRVAAYCFKCNDFLCKDCHNFHVTNKMMEDHQKHTLSLEDIETKDITIEKLASMRDAPRCHIHLEEISKLYCETCSHLPVCMACSLGEHRGHNLHEVKASAKVKKEELANKLKALGEIEKDKILMKPREAKQNLLLNVSIEKEKVINVYDEKDQKIMTKIQDVEGRILQVKQEKQNKEKNIFDSLQREMENKILAIKENYEEKFNMKKTEIGGTFQERERSLENELTKLLEKRERFKRDKTELLEAIEKQLNENVHFIESVSEYLDNMNTKFENLNILGSSILASDNDWSAVQCIPDMCTVATNLMKDFKKDFPELKTLTDVTVNYKQYSFEKPSVTKISEHVQKKIIINDMYCYIFGMTSSGDGNFVISGVTSGGRTSFIIVSDINGRILKGKILKSAKYRPERYCKSLSKHKVASVCQPNEIGLYDVRDGSFIKKNMSDVINILPKDWRAICVATDPVNNHILVGGYNSRDVYVFDDQLNYLHILTLPEMIKCPRDMTVSDGHLLVCDYLGEKCYLTTMDELESKLVGELMIANLERNSLRPRSVCTDRNGFTYVLWKSYGPPQQCYLVQYNHDGIQVLATRKLDGRASVVIVVETSQGEKLLVATYDTQTVYLYDLITED